MASSSRSKTRAGPWWTFLSCPASLITQPSGARMPRRMAMPPRGLSVWSSGRITSWPAVSVRIGGFLGEGAAGDGHAPSHRRSLPSTRRLAITPMPPALSTSAATILAARLDVHEDRRARQDGFEIVDGERQLRPRAPWPAGAARRWWSRRWRPRRRWRCRRPCGCRCRAAGCSLRTAFMMTSPQRKATCVLALIHLRHGGGAHRREADQFHDGGHGVGGELAAAGAGAGAGVVFDIEQLGVAHLAARVARRRLRRRPEW